MTKPIKKITPEKVAVLHVCSQTDVINQLVKNTDKLSVILTGDGTPEKGYVFKVIEIGKEIKDINTKLTGVNATVKELYDDSIGNKSAVKTKAEIRAERRLEWAKYIQTGMFILGAIALIFTAINTYNGNKKIVQTESNIKKEIQQQEGISKVTRSGYVKYNDSGLSDSIKIR
jgi:hypothetical protein